MTISTTATVPTVGDDRWGDGDGDEVKNERRTTTKMRTRNGSNHCHRVRFGFVQLTNSPRTYTPHSGASVHGRRANKNSFPLRKVVKWCFFATETSTTSEMYCAQQTAQSIHTAAAGETQRKRLKEFRRMQKLFSFVKCINNTKAHSHLISSYRTMSNIHTHYPLTAIVR